jgi:dethiobiotin synthetase
MTAVPLRLLVVGTGTSVGKTWVTLNLCRGLRALGRRLWVHKPIAAGGWDGHTAEDGRRLAALAGDGQDPALICPLQYAAEAAPAVAGELAGEPVARDRLRANLERCLGGDHDLVVEGAGGLLSPLTSDREGILAVTAPWHFEVILVATPELGTLNATALTIAELRRHPVRLLGLVLNQVRPDSGTVTTRTAGAELARLVGEPLIARVGHGQDGADQALVLAQAVLGRHERAAAAPPAPSGRAGAATRPPSG